MDRGYSDFVGRMLVFDDTLRRPMPREPLDVETVIRIRETPDEVLLGAAAPQDPALVPVLRAGLFYFHDALEEARRLVPDVPGPLADYWRQMIHRRLGEFEQARDFGRRAGELAPFSLMLRLVKDDSPSMARQRNWDAYLLNALWEQFRFGEAELERELRRLQRVEFDQIFHYTWRLAMGEP